jgi:hypothetical protein
LQAIDPQSRPIVAGARGRRRAPDKAGAFCDNDRLSRKEIDGLRLRPSRYSRTPRQRRTSLSRYFTL